MPFYPSEPFNLPTLQTHPLPSKPTPSGMGLAATRIDDLLPDLPGPVRAPSTRLRGVHAAFTRQ